MGLERLGRNISSSLVYEVCLVLCNFILPRAILGAYGSNVNGLVSSITQFLSVSSFFELGVGAVIQSSLYKPLVDKDNEKISRVMVSGQRFFRQLALIFACYVLALVFLYPMLVDTEFGWLYTVSMILVLATSSFVQYYFGFSNRILLTADQKGFVSFNAQTVSLIANTAACLVLIALGASIHIVKLATCTIFILRIAYLSRYVKRHYSVDWSVDVGEDPIEQKWNGIAQHLATVVQNGIDVIVLSVASTLASVSVYSVYNLVASGLKNLVTSMTSGTTQLMGELYARNEDAALVRFFGWAEWLIHTVVTIVFGIAAVMIVPFVQVYTSGIDDIEYIRPLFSAIMIWASAIYCYRLPYNMMILACGRFRETQKYYMIAVGLKLILSFVLVLYMEPLTGVALSYLLTMCFQLLWSIVYTLKHLCTYPVASTVRQYVVNMMVMAMIMTICKEFSMVSVSNIDWIVTAVKVSLVAILISLSLNLLFYKQHMLSIAVKIAAVLKIKRGGVKQTNFPEGLSFRCECAA